MRGEESPSVMSAGKYTYIHDLSKGPPEAIDIHRIVVRRNAAKGLVFRFFVLLLFANVGFLLFLKGKSIMGIYWSFILVVLLIKVVAYKQIEKESILILPGLGIQLETQYKSGHTAYRFISINKILKPLLYECVTPVTCFWCLSLATHDEEELVLVFKELRPPVKLLLPIWKALCSVVSSKQHQDALNT